MIHNRLKQENRVGGQEARETKGPRMEKRKEQHPPVVRSPALESAEQERSARQQARQQKSTPGAHPARRSLRPGKFEAQAVVMHPVRKRLPRLKNRQAQRVEEHSAQFEQRKRTGLTAAWRLRAPEKEEQTSLPAQVISEEEQKKLAELEMRLPRVAGKIDSWMLIIVLTLLCIGLVMVFSASSFVAARDYGDASYFFVRQLLSSFMGVIVMLVTMRIDYRLWRKFSLAGMAVALPLLVIVLRFGSSAYGASRWLGFGSFFSFQPSELIKLVLALYIADWLARKGKQVGTFLYGLAPFIMLVGLILGLILLENDMGTAIIIAGFTAAMFFTAGANIAQFALTMGCGGLIFLTQAFRGYRYFRLMGFLHPFQDVRSINLQLYQSLLALGSGGWFGLGLGASRQKTGYLPLPHIDSIFAIIGEELGFIGCTVIIILFLFLAFRGFRLARRAQDMYGALLATGITTWLVLQAAINIGATTGSIPYTGVPLPFISYGGSSLVISLAGVGVLLNISRYMQEPDDPVLSGNTITLKIRGRKKEEH